MLDRAVSMVLAQAGAPARGSADVSSLSRMHVLVIVLGAALLLLAWLVIVTVMRRALRSVGPGPERKGRADPARPTPWEQAGQRAQPMEETKGRSAGGDDGAGA